MAQTVQFVAHRVNDPSRLDALDPDLGAEIDIRSECGRLILQHEPNASGPKLSEFLDAYARTRKERLLILNPKEDGHDEVIVKMLAERDIDNYFFLDLSAPSMVRMAVRGWENRIAARVSEYEPPEAALKFKGKVDWVWLDCFSGEAPDAKLVRELRKDFKICLVSPELEGHPPEWISDFKPLSDSVDAVCTKHPDRWRD